MTAQPLLFDSAAILRGAAARIAAIFTNRTAWRQPVAVSTRPREVRRIRQGDGCCEFLIAMRRFEETSDGTQRHRLLAAIVGRFLQPAAPMPVPVSDSCRRAALTEWSAWAHKETIPPGVQLKQLMAAHIEVSTLLVVGVQFPLTRVESV